MNILRSEEQGYRAERRTRARPSVRAAGEFRRVRLAGVQAMYRLPTQRPHDTIEMPGVAHCDVAAAPVISSIREFSSSVQGGRSSVTGRTINTPHQHS